MVRLTINSVLKHSSMKMPAIGFGTWQIKPEEIDTALNAAIDAGYRHIDTAYAYRNEDDIGTALKKMFESGKIKREDLFITTKLPPWANRREDVEAVLETSLARLQLNYVDLYLIHSPMGLQKPEDENTSIASLGLDMETDLLELWKGMEAQVEAGRTKYIGISKFNQSQIQRILDNCKIRPASLQNELHIYLQEKELVSFCYKNDITVTAFSAFGSPGTRSWSESARAAAIPLEDPIITEIAKKYNKQPSHILIRYLIEYGVAVIPKSSNPIRIKQNIDVFDFELSKEDYDKISNLDRGENGRIFGSVFFNKSIKHPEYPFPK
ncbi:1,5-anhydro-D-fructose reductase [Halyomorpha halys]|uniref:1,5-anhydro-D-fructose reductase n=1 Tax=Halyomorpha halys TaxID=286706 RepID=UPI0006D4D6B8|nr:1,5-anhydro-D-fructose reductase-like [Halyomorpha halys]